MKGTAWKSSDRQKTDRQARSVQERRDAKTRETTGLSPVVRALLAGASPERLGSLIQAGGPGIPNSVMLELLSQQREAGGTPFRPLPENAPESEPFSWAGPAESVGNGAADALPPPLSAAMPCAALSFSLN